jgi:ApaG protein
MYEAVTHRVKVTVEPAFDPERSDPDEPRYFWRYSIEIANLGDKPVTLIDRHWRITDAHGRLQEVDGPGVVGEQPTIAPGKSFRYTSGCPLTTQSGMMVGEYQMVDADGRSFKSPSPPSPSTLRTRSAFSTKEPRPACRRGPETLLLESGDIGAEIPRFFA